jgi:hypothetical protein
VEHERKSIVKRKIASLNRILIRKGVKFLEKRPRADRIRLNKVLAWILPIRAIIENAQVRRLNKSSSEPLFELERSKGFCKFKNDERFTNMLVAFAQSAKERHLRGSKSKNNSKDYLRQIWNLSEIDKDSFFILEWAVQANVLKSVSHYFEGKYPLLHEISVFYSPETEVDKLEKWQGSQLFHMDGGGTQCVKIWMLCQDVEPEHGPTVVVSAEQSSRLAKSISYKPGTKLENDAILTNLEKLQTFALTGEKGSWFATDTDRSFHYGSRTTEQSSRLVVMFHYVDNNSSYYMPVLSNHYTKQLKSIPNFSRELLKKSKIAESSLRYRLSD